MEPLNANVAFVPIDAMRLQEINCTQKLTGSQLLYHMEPDNKNIQRKRNLNKSVYVP